MCEKRQFESAQSIYVDQNTLEEKNLIYNAMLKRSRNYKSKFKITGSEYYLKQAERLEKHAFRYRYCSYEYIQLKCNNCDQVYLGPARCESRICTTCSQKYGLNVFKKQEEVSRYLRNYKKNRIMFLTLTFKVNKNKELHKDDLRRANKCARKLINKLYPKKEGAGGFSTIEIGKNNNIHIHALVYGRFYHYQLISNLWKKITKDSFIVDIQVVKNTKFSLNYILKYINKPPTFETPEKMAIYIDALFGVRRIHTYGIFYGIKIKNHEKFHCFICDGSLGFLGIDGGMGIDQNAMFFEEARELKKLEEF